MTQSILTDIKKAAKKSLKAQQDALANTQKQLEILNGGPFEDGELPYELYDEDPLVALEEDENGEVATYGKSDKE